MAWQAKANATIFDDGAGFGCVRRMRTRRREPNATGRRLSGLRAHSLLVSSGQCRRLGQRTCPTHGVLQGRALQAKGTWGGFSRRVSSLLTRVEPRPLVCEGVGVDGDVCGICARKLRDPQVPLKSATFSWPRGLTSSTSFEVSKQPRY